MRPSLPVLYNLTIFQFKRHLRGKVIPQPALVSLEGVQRQYLRLVFVVGSTVILTILDWALVQHGYLPNNVDTRLQQNKGPEIGANKIG